MLFQGGDGSEGNPWQIANLADLSELCQTTADWDNHFIQTANIDASVTQYWDDAKDDSDDDKYNDDYDETEEGNNEGFFPIGNSTTKFTGSYDGDGHTISNLHINRSSINIGLFGYIYGASIENIGVVDCNITGNAVVSGLVGTNWNSSTISNSYSTCNVSGYNHVGGLVGYNTDASTISNCYSTGNITRTTGTGTSFGSFCGSNLYSSTIEYCYSTGKVYQSPGTIGSNGTKGFVGENITGSYTNNFFDSDASEQTSGIGATAKTTAEMKTQSTFTDWDFTSGTGDWKIEKIETRNYISYPYLAAISYDDPGNYPKVNPIPGLYTESQLNDVWYCADYTEGNCDGHIWEVDAFNNLLAAQGATRDGGTVHQACQVETPVVDYDMDGKTVELGTYDFEMTGDLTGDGCFFTNGSAHLVRTGVQLLEFPFCFNGYIFHVIVSWQDLLEPQQIGSRMNPDDYYGQYKSIIGAQWHLEGPDGLEATIQFMIPQDYIPNKSTLEQYLLSDHVKNPLWREHDAVVTEGTDDYTGYWVVTVTGVDQF